MNLELKISEKVQSIEDFLDSIKREKSRFKVRRMEDHLATLHLQPKLFSLFSSYGSPAVFYVEGVIDKSVLNTLAPSIKIVKSATYKLIQILIIAGGIVALIPSFKNQDFWWGLGDLAFVLVFLGFNHLLLQVAMGVFHGTLHDEINSLK